MTPGEITIVLLLSGLLFVAASALHVFRRKVADASLRRDVDVELSRYLESLQLAMEASQAGYYDLDRRSGAAYWSPRALEILGRDLTNAPTPAMLPTLVHPDDLNEFLAEREDFRANGRPLDIELRLRHTAGHYIWTHLRAISPSGEKGESGRVIGLIRDISPRRRAEEAVVRSEKKLRDLVEGSIQAILILDRDVPVFCNRTCAVLFGYDSPEELIARGSFLPHLTQEIRENFEAFWTAWMRGEHDGLVRRRQLLNRYGKRVEVEVVARRIQWDGKPAWQATMFDVTERSRVEEKLRASEEQFRLLATHASDVILVYDAANVVTFASPSFELVTGYPPSHVLGRAGLELIHPEDLPGLLARRNNLRNGTQKPSEPLRWRLLHRNGGIRWIETTNAILPAKAGNAPEIVSASRDITERVEREIDLSNAHDRLERQAQDLSELARSLEAERQSADQANAAKSRFLAMMSHELRTPMTGVLGIADLLRATDLNEEQRELTRLLTRSARMLLEILNDILDFSKIEAGQLEIEKTPFKLSDIVTDVENIFASAAAEKGLELTAALPDSYQDRVIGDPKRTRQVLVNLVNNAVKFTEHGAVRITLKQHEEHGKLIVAISVRDSGIGIAQTDIPRLFSPFIQADASTSRKYGGTGLGLAICKRLVEAMHGSIGVESEPERGSCFTFTLAVRPAGADDVAPAPEPVAEAAALTTQPRRILLAEDNETSRFLIARMLRRNGHAVEEVENGARALEAISREDFDIVLMDMQMPVMDGPEATRAIRKLPGPRAAIPVVALTADVIADHKKTYLQAGVNAVVGKPVNWAELEREIERLLRGGVAASEAVVELAPDKARQGGELLDDSALALLVEALGADALANMIGSFVENMSAYRAELNAAVAIGDLKKAKRVAHALKGLCAQFGAPRCAALAQFVEDHAMDIAEAQSVLAEIEAVVSATEAAFAARKQSLTATAKAS